VEEIEKAPTIIISYPKEIKSFYMKQNGNTVNTLDVLLPYIGEVIGGSERETNYENLKLTMIERNIDNYDYLNSRLTKNIPHSGFGMGIERLMMAITGITDIREVSVFS
jgi:asparaginyl-tRNA synthetase